MLKKFLSLLPFLVGCASNTPPLATVENVDIDRYVGKWYDVASFPQRFQKGCHCTSATYTVKDGYIEVYNSCYKKEKGRMVDITGKAFIDDSFSNAKLKVQFFRPFKANYWIIGLDEEYQFAVIGEPKRKYLWILSRNPHPEEEELQKWIALARQKGFDVSRLERVVHDCK